MYFKRRYEEIEQIELALNVGKVLVAAGVGVGTYAGIKYLTDPVTRGVAMGIFFKYCHYFYSRK